MNEGQNAGRGIGGASNRMNFGTSNLQGGGLASNPQRFPHALFKALLLFGILIGGAILQSDVNAYFNPEVKQSTEGNWMQCYALQYGKMTGGGTALGGAKIGHVASTKQICAYVDADGNMLTGNVALADEPSGTVSLIDDLGGNGNPKVFFEVGNDKHTIDFHQCNDGSYGSECTSSLAKTWTAEKGVNFEALMKEINDFANEKYGDYTKKPFESNENSGELTQELSSLTTYGAGSIESMCQQAGLKGLSWVACPVMDNTVTTVSALDGMIGNWLEVDTNLYDSSSAAYQVWIIMRDIANVMVVLVLLVIIFSQLTGVGIDNYGIKRMLPRLIAMAILINLSFVACQLAVDISNIFGVSLNTLFRNVGAQIMPDDAAIGNFLAIAITSIFAAAGVLGAASGSIVMITIAAFAGGGVLAVVVILLALIPVLAAVLLFFIMLGARMVLVIMCTAVAPVVAVLYILPNTQKWAKKWWNLFFAMLVMYPLCGAIAGISYLIKAMVLSMDGVHLWMIIVGIIGPFLPFFMLPMLLKNAISMLGAAGDALTAMGRGWRNGLAKGADTIQRTEAVKNKMRLGSGRLNRVLAGLDENGQETERGERIRERARSARGKRRGADRLLALRRSAVNKDMSEIEAAGAILTQSAARSGIAAAAADPNNAGKNPASAFFESELKRAAQSKNLTDVNSVIKAMVESGYLKDKEVAKIVRDNRSLIKSSVGDDAAYETWNRDTATRYGNGFLQTDYELSHSMKNGGNGMYAMGQNEVGEYGAYAKRMVHEGQMKVDDLKKEELSVLSGDSLAGMISAGLVTSAVSQQILAENPNISEDKKVMFGATAAGLAGAGIDAAKFKQDVGAIVRSAGYEAVNAMGGIFANVGSEMVKNWVAPPQQKVFISQDTRGGYLQQFDDVDVKINHRTPPKPPVNNGGAYGADSVSE